jgi:peptidoglycan/LPS O-acetylase OafA/YrhL
MPLIDVLKGVSCVLIVWHHLAFYGPMSDAALPLAPQLIAWLYDYGRLAVQVFLVVAGYLAASGLAPTGTARFAQPWMQIGRRYSRLAIPYLLALGVSMLVSAAVRPWFSHESVPDAPQLLQVLSHVLLLQGLVGHDALSAGVWYIAIDFQLFTLAVLGLALARWVQQRLQVNVPLGVWGVLVLMLASLLYFNLHSALDDTALYFFGAYGLGMLAFWAGRSGQARGWLAALALVGVAALMVEFRSRIATAVAVALWLGAATAWPRLQAQFAGAAWLRSLGQMSYSVFLIHFPVCLLANAVVHELWPHQPWVNLLGMVGAFGLSLGAGAWLYSRVEVRPWGAWGAQKIAGVGMVLLPFLAVCAGFTWAFSY